jgi:hypothetical protein
MKRKLTALSTKSAAKPPFAFFQSVVQSDNSPPYGPFLIEP